MVAFDKFSGQFIDAIKMGIAAKVTNDSRNALFWQKLNDGYRGPRVLVEGDSWVCYPDKLVTGGPRDLISHMSSKFAIATQAQPGDLVANMVDTLHAEGGILKAITVYKPDVLVVSGGGNDLLGAGRLATFLNPGKHALPDYFRVSYDSHFWTIIDGIKTIARAALRTKPALKIVVHGYAYTAPLPGGPWLQAPMDRLDIPQRDREPIIRRMVDQFNEALIQLSGQINREGEGSRVFHADLRRRVAKNRWFDEIHPTTEGFSSAASGLATAIRRAYRSP
jgi:hypothetical protein